MWGEKSLLNFYIRQMDHILVRQEIVEGDNQDMIVEISSKINKTAGS